MKKTLLSLCAATALFSSCESNSNNTTEPVKDTATRSVTTESKPMAAKPDSATCMKNWVDYATPGEVHKMMSEWNGKWDGEVSMWHSPDAPPETSKTSAENKMIMGGRYQQSTHSGNMMGMPFEGLSTMGYDNAKKEFENTWIDNMGTGIMILRGKWDDASKTITLTGKCVAAEMGDGSEMGVKQTFKIVDADHHEMQMFMVTEDGKETKTMEIKYVRKK